MQEMCGLSQLSSQSWVTKSQNSVNTKGMLPTGQLVFLSEIFKASRNVLSILLSILNERIFVNGPVSQAVPLHFAVGASNEVFLDPAQSPLLGRFPLHVLVEGRDVKERRKLTNGVTPKRLQHDYVTARAAAKTAAEAAAKNKIKLDENDVYVAPSDPEIISLVADIFAMLDAVAMKGAQPLPEDVQTLLFELVDYANKLDLAGVIAAMPKTHTTRTQEVYCGNVITNRGIVMFSDMVRIMAYLHGRPQTPCIFDLYPFVYMAWRTNDQRTTVTVHIVAAITVALPELAREQGAVWVYAAIRDHLFVPDAVKPKLVSHLLPHLIQAGRGEEALEALTKDPRVNPGRVEEWDKNRVEWAARQAAEEAKQRAEETEAKIV
ncbi:hypothetical protein AMAG_17477 [Allomyces macrogynus ATCC 38327]|uniref:MoxR domain-containing protein n=1 Tax=Allomyces macrogynus (strain ATCC 38327) TaxID=578462 RepID=A0A0L0TFD1_ALLM3|nr:hypothetical protein AMAG_17477 [Allomyces macrogynus ATCC 38327]|eukprot:KNE73309.1 hypothetical protein AMAG_17477 [Allomyces macrogynus ATCC 38327]